MEHPSPIRFFLLAVTLLQLVSTGTAAAEDAPLRLTLKDAIRMAVEKNLEVRAELYNPAMGEADIRSNRGIYDPLLTLSADYQDSTTQPASIFLSGARISRQKNLFSNAGVSQLVPIGGTVGLFFNNLWNRNNSDISRGFLDEYWQSELTVSYSQPLLKNFGREATELGIAVAVNSKVASLDQFRSRLIDIVTRTRTAYFLLQSLRENLEAKKTALTLASKILDDTKGRVR
ncbi:MAG: TolC family protein, partial [Deltaproteobacteria bacterium]|nr:TolC family protein [Deltaproteobacteria bacterium]